MSFRDMLQRRAAEKTAEKAAEAKATEEKQTKLLRSLKAGRKTSTVGDAELRRVLDLPISVPLTGGELEDFNRQIVNADKFMEGWRLFPPQAQAIHDFMRYGGLFAPVGVGWGKTLITLKCAAHAYSQGVRKIMLLLPPEVFSQLTKRDIPWTRKYTSLGVPFFPLGKKSLATRKKMVESGRPGCYIMPYSLLSTRDTDFLLDMIRPGLLICDEAHLIKNTRAARTRRLLNYISEHNPQMVALSGTITNKGIKDYHHLLRICLAAGCPIPRSPIMAGEWGAIIDADADFLGFDQTRAMVPLLNWAKEKFPEEAFPVTTSGFRSAYRHRLTSTPGVVATSDEEIGTSLLIENIKVANMEKATGFKRLKELMANVQDNYETPNGDEIEHAIHTFKWLNELSAGFYNELVWPTEKAWAKKKKISLHAAKKELERAQEHHRAHQDYLRELRLFLQGRPPSGMDTPMLVGLEISRNKGRNVGSLLSDLWHTYKGMEWEGMPQREGNVVRVCDYKIQEAVRWAKALPQGVGGVIWTHHQEVGKWVMEALKSAGVKALHCPAGNAGGERIMDPKNADKVCVASIEAHGTGKNLQHFCHQLYVQWPRPAKTAEQSLGRLHRNGQEADTVVTTCLRSLPFDDILFAATLNDAVYISQTTGLRQRLIKASYNPLPAIFSPEFLQERGMENQRLNQEQRQLLNDRFGEQQ